MSMNTKVTIVVNPQEFDLIRDAVKSQADDAEALVKAKDLSPKERQEWRAKAFLLRDLQGKLNS
jgi:hypothetical protein